MTAPSAAVATTAGVAIPLACWSACGGCEGGSWRRGAHITGSTFHSPLLAGVKAAAVPAPPCSLSACAPPGASYSPQPSRSYPCLGASGQLRPGSRILCWPAAGSAIGENQVLPPLVYAAWGLWGNPRPQGCRPAAANMQQSAAKETPDAGPDSQRLESAASSEELQQTSGLDHTCLDPGATSSSRAPQGHGSSSDAGQREPRAQDHSPAVLDNGLASTKAGGAVASGKGPTLADGNGSLMARERHLAGPPHASLDQLRRPRGTSASTNGIDAEDLLQLIKNAERNILMLSRGRTRAMEEVRLAHAEKQALQGQLEMLEGELSKSERKLYLETQRNLQAKLLEEQLQVLQARVDRLQLEADRAMDLDVRLAQAQAQLVETKGTTQLLQEVEEARDRLQNQVAILEQRLMELEARMQEATSTRKRLQEELDAVFLQLEGSKSALAEQEGQVEELRTSRDALLEASKKNKGIKEELDEATGQVASLQAQLVEMETEKHQTLARLEGMEHRLREAEKQSEQAAEEKLALDAKLRDRDTVGEALQSQARELMQLQGAKRNWEEKVHLLERQLAESTAGLEQGEKDDKIAAQHAQILDLEGHLARLQALEHEAEALRKELAEQLAAGKALESARGEIEELRQQLEAAYQREQDSATAAHEHVDSEPGALGELEPFQQATAAIKKLEDEVTRVQATLEERERELEDEASKRAAIEAESVKLRNHVKEFRGVQETVKGLRLELAGAQGKLAEAGQLAEQLQAAQPEQSQLAHRLVALQAEQTAVLTEVRALEEAAAEIDNMPTEIEDLERLLEGSPEYFDSRGATVSVQLAALRARMTAQQRRSTLEVLRLQDEMKQLRDVNGQLTSRLDELAEGAAEVEQLRMRTELLEEEEQMLRDLVAQSAPLEQVAGEVGRQNVELQGQLARMEEERDSWRRRAQDIQEEVASFGVARRPVPAGEMPWEFWSELLLRIDELALARKLTQEQGTDLRTLAQRRDVRIRDKYVALQDAPMADAAAGLRELVRPRSRHGQLPF